MRLIARSNKPKVNLDLPPLCSFRSSKGYLWSLIRDRLSSIQESSNRQLHILDAACHALITRNMFPASSFYYGLDISSYRLKQSFALRRQKDVLYRADLTHPLGLSGAFDVVVSCNTMSHLPPSQQNHSLTNLCHTLKKGGDLFVNFSFDPSLFSATEQLLRDFESVEPIYFNSFLSAADELNSRVDQNNILAKIASNELSVPNDACLHRQVLLHAHNKLKGDVRVGTAPRSRLIKTLNVVPKVDVFSFKDDMDALNLLLASNNKLTCLMTPGLFDSPYARAMIADNHSITFKRLDESIENSDVERNIYILGLEDSWTMDVHVDRWALNRVREFPDINIYLLLVSSRNGISCKPSLIATDY